VIDFARFAALYPMENSDDVADEVPEETVGELAAFPVA
jgi:hypothetical protein